MSIESGKKYPASVFLFEIMTCIKILSIDIVVPIKIDII